MDHKSMLSQELIIIKELSLSIKQFYELAPEQEQLTVLNLTLAALNTCFRAALSMEPIPADDEILNCDVFNHGEQSTYNSLQHNIIAECHKVLTIKHPQQEPNYFLLMDNYLLIAQIAENFAYIIKSKYEFKPKILENFLAYEQELKDLLNTLNSKIKTSCNWYILDKKAWADHKSNIKQLLKDATEQRTNLIMQPFLPFWLFETEQNLTTTWLEKSPIQNSITINNQVTPTLKN